MIRMPSKSPGEVKFYTFDWGERRLDAGEVILASEWEVTSGTVEIAASPAPSFDGSTTTVYLQGGTIGEEAVVLNTVETSLNPVREFSGRLKVKAI